MLAVVEVEQQILVLVVQELVELVVVEMVVFKAQQENAEQQEQQTLAVAVAVEDNYQLQIVVETAVAES